jgi:probable addiction module antidote protein
VRTVPIETFAFEPDKYFQSPEAQAHLVSDAMASGNAGYIADALGIVARNRGMGQVAERTGLSRQALYSTLSARGNPTLSTILKVFDALNLEITVRVKEAA